MPDPVKRTGPQWPEGAEWEEMRSRGHRSDKSGSEAVCSGKPDVSRKRGVAVVTLMFVRDVFRMYRSVTGASRGLGPVQGELTMA